RKRFELDAGCLKYAIDVLAIQEHRQRSVNDLEHYKAAHGTFVLASANDRGVGGIGFYFSSRAAKLLCHCEKVSDRILTATFEGNPALV
ncbi:hypothetical protein, partial [Klebsiella pneumoniae]|uniref:hypothetical protein n=1 Tax=Klebsiella pneumoniae TaxID=573 RepID=UPI003B98334D